MAEEEATTPPVKKESETLTKMSLLQLARGLGKDPEGLTFPMLLNLPTSTIIKLIYDYSENGLLGDDGRAGQASVVDAAMMLWREDTLEMKPKERVRILERALRNMGKMEVADGLMDRFANNTEIAPDLFNVA